MNPKYRRVDHGGTPFFAAGQLEQESKATNHFRPVGNMGIAACQGEAADDGDTSSLEDCGL